MQILEDIEGLVSNRIEVFKTILTIVKLETRLAGLSIYPLIFNIAMILVVLMTVWSSVMILMGHSLMYWYSSFMLGVLGVLSLNLLIAWGLFKYLTFNLKNMSFEKTRAYFNRGETPHAYVTHKPSRKITATRKKVALSSTKRK